MALNLSIPTNPGKSARAVRQNAGAIRCIFFAALFFVLFGCGGSPAASEQDNFRGLKWGTQISSLPGFETIAGEGDLSFYRKTDESLQFEDVKLDQVVYGAHKGRFYTAIVYFPAAHFARIKEITARKLGEAAMPDKTPTKLVWDGSNVTVLLTMAEGADQARLAYIYKPIQLEVELKK